MRLVLLGPPGAGKGTQAAALAQELGLAHIASGDLFRAALERGTELGLQAKSYMEQGKLVPNEITIKMILERLEAPDARNGFILDGFPRNLGQAQALDEALSQRGLALDKVVSIEVSTEELVRRLGERWVCRSCQTPYHLVNNPPQVAGRCDQCGGELYQRADDTEETIRKRLEVYSAETAPLIDYYKRQGKLVAVDGEPEVAAVSRELLSALGVEVA